MEWAAGEMGARVRRNLCGGLRTPERRPSTIVPPELSKNYDDVDDGDVVSKYKGICMIISACYSE